MEECGGSIGRPGLECDGRPSMKHHYLIPSAGMNNRMNLACADPIRTILYYSIVEGGDR
jgi:hypothetical protein